jgi:hypothetical protein
MTAETAPITSTHPGATRTGSRARTVGVIALAAVTVAAATTLVAAAALALGADPTFVPLQPAAYLSFAIAGVFAAIGGWVLVVRFVRPSARALAILVPVLLALTLNPDIALLILGFIPGATVTGVVALMLMHPIVAVTATLAGRAIAPPR